MKNIVINYKVRNKVPDLSGLTGKCYINLFDFRLAKNKIDIDGVNVIPMSFEDYEKSNNVMLEKTLELNSDQNACCLAEENYEIHIDNIPETVFSDPDVYCAYGDHKHNNIRLYLKSPPVTNLQVPLLLININKLKDFNLGEDGLQGMFQAGVTKHIPEILCTVRTYA